eukprot:4396782-Prymnesium_polylepis.2
MSVQAPRTLPGLLSFPPLSLHARPDRPASPQRHSLRAPATHASRRVCGEPHARYPIEMKSQPSA